MTRAGDIGTCVATLSRPGRCCVVKCTRPATFAVLFDSTFGLGFTECLRCDEHRGLGAPLQSKPYQAAPGWEPVDHSDDLRARVAQLESTLAEVLGRFTDQGHPGRPCRRTGWQTDEQVAAWRAILRPNGEGANR